MSTRRPAMQPGLDAPRVTRYHVLLLAAVATSNFFEGFDQTIIGVVAPYVALEFGLGADGLGAMLSIIGVGAVLAFLVTMQADRFGRRRLLLITVIGYGVGTGLTALAQGAASFVLLQMVTRTFLFAEVALAIVIVGEEFPAARRGFAISLLIAAGVAGGVASAFALGPVMEQSHGWRAMYAIGALPVLLAVPLRFFIRETRRYAAMNEGLLRRDRASVFAVWRPPHRRWLVPCILFFGLVGALASTYPSFYAWFLVHERGFSPSEVSTTFGFATLMGLPAIPLAGWLLDRHGRRALGVLAPLLLGAGVLCVFNVSGSQLAITLAGMAGVFVGTLAMPIPSTYMPELFPTRVRSLAAGWVSNGMGRAIVVTGPALTGFLAARLGSVSLGASAMAVCGVFAAAIVYFALPETKGRRLEDTAGEFAGGEPRIG